jgi:hypothetical protein
MSAEPLRTTIPPPVHDVMERSRLEAVEPPSIAMP